MTSQSSPTGFRVRIAPTGDAVLRGADGRHPDGYLPLGGSWAIRVGSTLHDKWTRYEAAGASENKDEMAAALALAKLKSVWSQTLAPLISDLTRLPAVSAAGLPMRGRILAPLEQEPGRKAQIEDYVAAVQSPHAAKGVPAAIDLILRQLDVLQLPSMSEARLRMRAPGHWMLQFVEAGPLETLLGAPPAGRLARMNSAFDDAISASEGSMNEEAAAKVMAASRAVQLAWIWAACWTSGMPRLDVEVQHSGLGEKALLLSIPPEGWGLPLARLARKVAEAREQKGFPFLWPKVPGASPRLELVAPSATEPPQAAWHDHAPGLPLEWQEEDAGILPRWTYSGAAGLGEQACRDLPFALSPQRRLAGLDPQAFGDWLAGPRRQAGFRPEFALVYLQGLEYRLLAESPPPEEQTLLVEEIEAVAALLDSNSHLAAQASELIDWLGATGRRTVRSMAEEGPLSVLVATARKVMKGAPLQHDEICAIARCLPDDDDLRSGASLLAAARLIPQGLQVKAPRVDLIASYRSISGLLDQPAHRFVQNGTPLPDLRVSARIRHLIARIRAAAEAEA